jgi:signal transduction histidine kinase
VTPVQVLELVLVGTGALSHLHIVQSRSSSARTLWFNPPLFLWTLSWTIWYASVFSTLNLETLSTDRFPWISMGADLVKGLLLCLQSAFLLQGISAWTGSLKRLPAATWFLVPAAMVVWGGWQVLAHPMRGFLPNVEPLALLFVLWDTLSCLVAAWMLARALRSMDHLQRSVARPLLKALVAMLPFLGAACWIKSRYGLSGIGRYDWVLLHDLAHLLPPTALLWAAYRTESVALEVTRSSLRRVRAFAGLLLGYLALKFAFPHSTEDVAATWFMAGLGLVGTLGPLVEPLGKLLSERVGWGLPAETALLSRLESRLWNDRIPDERLPEFCARGVGRILDCRWKVVSSSNADLSLLLSSRAGRPGPHAMFQARSRAEIPAWEALGARVVVPVSDPDRPCALVLGSSPKADRLPDPVLERLGSLGRTCGRVLEARHRLRRSLEDQRRIQDGERLAMLGLLSASAAHEIKNPLSAIRNVATAALREAPDGSVLRKDLAVVVGEVDRLDSTVRRMLHFARDRDACDDAPETARVVAGLLSMEARERGLSLEVGPAAPFAVPMSENDLKAVLFNLLQNALRHAPERSVVEVRLDPSGPALEVRNRGEVAPGMRSRLFLPMASSGGTGLGLYISRSKAEASGGTLAHRTESGVTVFRLAWDGPRRGEGTEG